MKSLLHASRGRLQIRVLHSISVNPVFPSTCTEVARYGSLLVKLKWKTCKQSTGVVLRPQACSCICSGFETCAGPAQYTEV
jgi:hypothetical protein